MTRGIFYFLIIEFLSQTEMPVGDDGKKNTAMNNSLCLTPYYFIFFMSDYLAHTSYLRNRK